MSDHFHLRHLEICIRTHHEVVELRRQFDAMAQRRSRGWLSKLPWLKGLPYVIAAFLLLTGHMTLDNLRDWIGVPRR